MRFLVALVALAAVACANGTTVTTTITHPAEVPVRAYPVVFVALGADPREVELGRRVQAYLAGRAAAEPQSEVRLADAAELDQMRAQGQMPVASVVLRLDLRTLRSVRSRTDTRPETVCDAFRCYTVQRTYLVDIPTVRMNASLRVEDGPTGRVLVRRNLVANDEGAPLAVLERRALERLSSQMQTMFDARSERVQARLLDVEDEGVQQAIEAIERGEWRDGRVRLEAAVRSESVHALPTEARARALYNLSVARRFDPTGYTEASGPTEIEAHYRSAEAPLLAAIELDPAERRYPEALAALRADGTRARTLAAQREAARHNHELGGSATAPPRAPTAPAPGAPGGGVPAPPPGYR